MELNIEKIGKCANFPCDVILEKPDTTVLDKEWLAWKKKSNTNR